MDPDARQLGVSFGRGGPMLGAPASSVLAQPGGISQQTPSSASFSPSLFPRGPQDQMLPMPQTQTQGQPMQPQLPPPPMQQPMQSPMMPQQGVVGMPPSNPEAHMIIKALSNRLNLHNKVEESKIPEQNPMMGAR
jgi:hypothetical protein